jgi:hypothetical protein
MSPTRTIAIGIMGILGCIVASLLVAGVIEPTGWVGLFGLVGFVVMGVLVFSRNNKPRRRSFSPVSPERAKVPSWIYVFTVLLPIMYMNVNPEPFLPLALILGLIPIGAYYLLWFFGSRR